MKKEELLKSLSEFKKEVDDLIKINVFKNAKEIIKNLENIDEKIELLNEEIEELTESAEKAKSDKNYSLYNVLRRTIAQRIDLLKKLYESRADLEGILQKYYDSIMNYKTKVYESELKTFKEIQKLEDTSSAEKVINEFILKLSGALYQKPNNVSENSPIKNDKIKNNSKLIMGDEVIDVDIDLPDEMKNF
jgi:uncharacterized protein YoxC